MKIVTRPFEVYIRAAVDILIVTPQPLITLTLTLIIQRALNVASKPQTLIPRPQYANKGLGFLDRDMYLTQYSEPAPGADRRCSRIFGTICHK